MDFTGILNQVLNAGQQLSGQRNDNNTFDTGSILKTIGGGTAAAGVLSLLLGKSGNKGFGQNALELGSLAAIGSMAYSAWKNYQAGKQAENQHNLQSPVFTPVEHYSAEQSNANSQLIIKAMIAAAAADGRIEQAESDAILAEIGSSSPEVQAWLQQQIQRPATVEEIAGEVRGDISLASQIYLASRIVCDDLDRKEIVYLNKLAEALNLDDALVEKLESQAGF